MSEAIILTGFSLKDTIRYSLILGIASVCSVDLCAEFSMAIPLVLKPAPLFRISVQAARANNRKRQGYRTEKLTFKPRARTIDNCDGFAHISFFPKTNLILVLFSDKRHNRFPKNQ